MASGWLGIPVFSLYVRPFSQGAYLFVSVNRVAGEGRGKKSREDDRQREGE